VADFVESCRKCNIKPGIYLSTHRNAYWQVWGHGGNWGRGGDKTKQAAFNRIAEKMSEELCSRYGELMQIWYDAGVKTPKEGGPDVLPIFEKHQPNSVFYHNKRRSDHRWIGNEAGHAGYPCWATMPLEKDNLSHNSSAWRKCLANGDPDGKAWSPGMVDVPLRGAAGVHSWFWRPNQDRGVYSTDALVEIYYKSVGRNCNLIIGEVITPEGLVPECDIRRLREFGKEIQRLFGRPLAETRGRGEEIELSLREPKEIDHVAIMEDIAHGERIRSYVVEGLAAPENWKRLSEGKSVGHKRIQRFRPVRAAKVRLRVLQSVAPPRIRSLAVFSTSQKSQA